MILVGEKLDEVKIGQRDTVSDVYMKHGIQDRLVYMKIPGARNDIFIDNDLLDDQTQERIKELTLDFIFANTD